MKKESTPETTGFELIGETVIFSQVDLSQRPSRVGEAAVFMQHFYSFVRAYFRSGQASTTKLKDDWTRAFRAAAMIYQLPAPPRGIFEDMNEQEEIMGQWEAFPDYVGSFFEEVLKHVGAKYGVIHITGLSDFALFRRLCIPNVKIVIDLYPASDVRHIEEKS